MSDQFNQDGGFGFTFFDIAEIVNYEEIVAIEFDQRLRELQVEFRLLQMLHQGSSSHKFDPFA